MSIIISEQGIQQLASSSTVSNTTRETATSHNSLSLSEILTRAHQVQPTVTGTMDTNGLMEPAESSVTNSRESGGMVGSLIDYHSSSDFNGRTLNEAHSADTLISSIANSDPRRHQVHSPADSIVPNSPSSVELLRQPTEPGQSSITTDIHVTTVESTRTPPRSRVQTTLDRLRPPPVLPNLAARALELLKEKEKESIDEEEDEFRPAKKRRIQDTETEDEV